ncbi:hypothetical protein J7K41_03280 [Candidatus Micrarchaeota archaeon]|nr:hypothetical protein [Candidatus Micrarchaeota archaeon]
MYNISKIPFQKEGTGFRGVYLLDDLDIFITDSVRIASRQCKRGKIVWLTSYTPSLELITKAKEKESALLVDLLDVVRTAGKARILTMRRTSNFLRLCVKFDVPYVLSMVARDRSEIRTAKEGIALAYVLGLSVPQAIRGFNTVGMFLR